MHCRKRRNFSSVPFARAPKDFLFPVKENEQQTLIQHSKGIHRQTFGNASSLFSLVELCKRRWRAWKDYTLQYSLNPEAVELHK